MAGRGWGEKNQRDSSAHRAHSGSGTEQEHSFPPRMYTTLQGIRCRGDVSRCARGRAFVVHNRVKPGAMPSTSSQDGSIISSTCSSLTSAI